MKADLHLRAGDGNVGGHGHRHGHASFMPARLAITSNAISLSPTAEESASMWKNRTASERAFSVGIRWAYRVMSRLADIQLDDPPSRAGQQDDLLQQLGRASSQRKEGDLQAVRAGQVRAGRQTRIERQVTLSGRRHWNNRTLVHPHLAPGTPGCWADAGSAPARKGAPRPGPRRSRGRSGNRD